jgi:CDP-diacylglycerol pyrophosphatase
MRIPVICALAIAAVGITLATYRDALWDIVHGLCVLHKVEADKPAPCTSVNLAGGEEAGSAVLKDLNGKTQFLLIPTRRLTGIEDPLVGTAALPNYWRDAWAARGLVSLRVQKELPRDAIGMAINAAGSRSQDQLHIHIDCIRPKVRNALLARMGGSQRNGPICRSNSRATFIAQDGSMVPSPGLIRSFCVPMMHVRWERQRAMRLLQ